MATVVLIHQPITGQEEIGDITEPQQVLARFYRAFNNRDLALMEDNWENSDEPVMISPIAGIKRGWREIRAGYEHLFSSPVAMRAEFYEYTLRVFGDLFYAAGRERGQYAANSVNLELGGFSTNIFQRSSKQEWRQVHHHVSLDPEHWAAYQAAIRESSRRT
jgi:ketosteroid isomerase-like protein